MLRFFGLKRNQTRGKVESPPSELRPGPTHVEERSSETPTQSEEKKIALRMRNQRTEATLRTLSHSKYYRALGIPQGASQQVVKSAYRRLVKENHPDLAHGNISERGKRFREIQIAYEALERSKLI